MAKVVAPLQSFSASGKIGKSLVFFGHLGRNVVRGLVTPANPQTAGQGSQRLLLGGLGRASKGVVINGDYYADVILVTPAGQTWVSNFIKNISNFFGTGATGVAAIKAAVTGHSATNWETQGASLGLSTVTISYADTNTEFTPGEQLYVLAQFAFIIQATNPTLFDRSPYTTALASWDSADVVSFVSDLTTIS